MPVAIQTPNDESLREICRKISACAGDLDASAAWPAEQLAWCRDFGLSRAFFDGEWGGLAWSEADLVRGWMRLGAACLATAFVLTQPAGAGRRIAASGNRELQERLLPRMVAGECFASVGIAHLTTSRRHLGRPMMSAREAGAAFVLDGVIPWVTGSAQAEVIVTGAELPDGKQIVVALPTATPGVVIPPPAKMVGLTSTHTGEVHCRQAIVGREWLIAGPVENVLASSQAGAKTGGLQTSALALGLADAALGYLADEAARRTDLEAPYDALRREHDELASDLLAAAEQGETASLDQIRARANSLVLRSTQAALTAAKGAGFVAGHPAGRWCREALFFLVWSCPQPVAYAAMCELAGMTSQ